MRTEPLPTEPAGAWWESPFMLALAGAIAIHLFVGTFGDALVVLHPPKPDPPPPPVAEMIEVEVKPPPPPPTPPPEVAPPAPDPEPLKPAVVPHVVAHAPVHAAEPPPPTEPPPAAPASSEGGGPVLAMPDVAPGATGVAVVKGPIVQHPGRGGTGTGAGTGSGTGEIAAMSVAMIKTRALPRGDYSYEESKDYPADARRLGIEGTIRVRLIIDNTGVVKSALLLNKLGHGLDELALARAKKIAFDPAKDADDKPVASVEVWTFNMTLPK